MVEFRSTSKKYLFYISTPVENKVAYEEVPKQRNEKCGAIKLHNNASFMRRLFPRRRRILFVHLSDKVFKDFLYMPVFLGRGFEER
jgi:hypothetical protein